MYPYFSSPVTTPVEAEAEQAEKDKKEEEYQKVLAEVERLKQEYLDDDENEDKYKAWKAAQKIAKELKPRSPVSYKIKPKNKKAKASSPVRQKGGAFAPSDDDDE